uniref:hypothetical protein n=1 Tax=Mesomycoplasma ovipneumoniae TaxID=29562 RepID=UPI003119865A
NPFTGHFDGNNHTVKMNVERQGKTAALFGTIKTQNSNYTVKNITVNGTVKVLLRRWDCNKSL